MNFLDKVLYGFNTALNETVGVPLGMSTSGSGNVYNNTTVDTSAIANALNRYLEYEKQATSAANNLQLQMNQDAMNFEAQQAELNRAFQQQSAQSAMNFEASQAQISREWSEKMSNTAYQRAVEDLKLAGLNPILSVSQGGASTPTSYSASGFSSSGSKGSGVSGKANKADFSALLSAVLTYNVGITNAAANLMKGIGSIIPL